MRYTVMNLGKTVFRSWSDIGFPLHNAFIVTSDSLKL